MTRKLTLFSSLAVLACVACATSPDKIPQEKPVPALYAEEGVALQGYDPVAYFTDGKPVEGFPGNTVSWHGVQWRFASPEHAQEFTKDPQRYAPQYGGYCALAVSKGTTASGDAHQWAVVDGKLYVNNNRLAKFFWDQDHKANIGQGDSNWPLIPKLASASEAP